MYKLYSIYKYGDKLIGSSSSIDYVVEFTKLLVDKEISTEKDSSRLKQLYEDKLVLNSPNVWLHKLKPILERLGYKLTVKLEVDIK